MGKQYYIKINGELIAVPEEVYREYMRAEWREAKQDTVRIDREQSYEFMLEHDLDGKTTADQTSVDEIVAKKLMSEELHAALAKLTADERRLIKAVYFDEKSERKIAGETGRSKTRIHDQKEEILEKLRFFLKNR